MQIDDIDGQLLSVGAFGASQNSDGACQQGIITMTSIDHFNLRSFDLNLLVAFDALMEERNVTRAATRLKIQQPAMSHSLSTLRMLLQDDVFVRVGQVMQPTGAALALAGPIRAALAQAQDALLVREVFEPAREARTFRLGLSSQLEILILPELTSRLRQIAPGIKIQARVIDADEAKRHLDDGMIDLAVGCFGDLESWHKSEVLFTDTLTCCFNPKLLKLPTPLSKTDFFTHPHVVVSNGDGMTGCIEKVLAGVADRINIVGSTPNFMAVLAMAEQAPVLTVLPTSIALTNARHFRLATSPVPAPFVTQSLTMVWHASSDRSPAFEWMRDQIRHVKLRITSARTVTLGSAVEQGLKPRRLAAA